VAKAPKSRVGEFDMVKDPEQPSPQPVPEVWSVKKPASSVKAPPPPPPKESLIFIPYDEPPAPIGGMAAIQKHLVYPESARKAGLEGEVVVIAVVKADGTLGDVRIDKGLEDEGMNRAAMEAVKAVKWKPGKQRDKTLDVTIAIPLTFKLK
jgi:protein TonB